VRLRIGLAAVVGLIVIPVVIWRLTLAGKRMARVFQVDGMSDMDGVLVTYRLRGIEPLKMMMRFDVGRATYASEQRMI